MAEIDYKNWEDNWKREQYVPVFIDKLSEAEAAYALREAWNRIYGEYPQDKSLALLWAQSALETGRWKVIRNNNFGNIKKKHYKKLSWKEIPDDGHNWTMFATGENLWNKELKKTEWHWFKPPHYQTHFRSYDTVVDGAEDYIKLVSQKERYKKAWQEVINGDPAAFSHELRLAGYYTASEAKYTAGVVRLVDEFMSRKNEMLSWKPEEKVKEEEPSKVEVQKIVEDVMTYTKNDGVIRTAVTDSVAPEPKVVEAQPAKLEKSPAPKTGLIVAIVAGLTAAYMWAGEAVQWILGLF